MIGVDEAQVDARLLGAREDGVGPARRMQTVTVSKNDLRRHLDSRSS